MKRAELYVMVMMRIVPFFFSFTHRTACVCVCVCACDVVELLHSSHPTIDITV